MHEVSSDESCKTNLILSPHNHGSERFFIKLFQLVMIFDFFNKFFLFVPRLLRWAVPNHMRYGLTHLSDPLIVRRFISSLIPSYRFLRVRPGLIMALSGFIKLFLRPSDSSKPKSLLGICCFVEACVILRLAVGVVGFAAGGIVDARGVCGCGTITHCPLCLDDHPYHPSLHCLEFLLHFFSHRPRARSVAESWGHRGVVELLESVSQWVFW